jgi:hypothetical protein
VPLCGAAIAQELRELFRFQKDEPLPERFTDLLRQLDSRKDTASPGHTASKPKGDVH